MNEEQEKQALEILIQLAVAVAAMQTRMADMDAKLDQIITNKEENRK